MVSRGAVSWFCREPFRGEPFSGFAGSRLAISQEPFSGFAGSCLVVSQGAEISQGAISWGAV